MLIHYSTTGTYIHRLYITKQLLYMYIKYNLQHTYVIYSHVRSYTIHAQLPLSVLILYTKDAMQSLAVGSVNICMLHI